LDLQRDFNVPMAQINEQFLKAVTLDPDFVLAWTEVIWQRLRAYWFGFDATEANLDLTRTALDRVTKLAPDSPHVQRAQAAYLYFVKRDFHGALDIMKRVQQGLPNDARTWFFTGLIERRAGLFDDAVAHLRKAQTLDPKDDFIAYELPNTATAQRRFDEVIALVKDMPKSNLGAMEIQLFAEWNLGGLDAAEPVLAELPSSPLSEGMRADQLLFRRDFRGASALYAKAIGTVGESPSSDLYQSELFMAGYLPTELGWYLRQAQCERVLGNKDAAKKLLIDVRNRAQAELAKKPVNLNIEAAWRATLALALANLGERDAAVSEATKATQLIPETLDRYEGPYWLDTLAAVYAVNGDAAHAVPLIRHLVDTTGSMTTRAMLALDPVWDPIRNDPAFQALVKP
ncbi:MAG TPA: hypothetical protein VH082_12055, partial [Rudaea sp.]|nr:hypothetical protein [Rudaea sp.]